MENFLNEQMEHRTFSRRDKMAKRTKKAQQPQTRLKDFVVVIYTEDPEQAKTYQSLLKANDIPVTVKKQNDSSTDQQTFVVSAPEEFLDEAHVIIESQQAYEDFYDYTFDDDDDDFDSEFVDDDL